jgi:hypothetical protein
MPEHLTKSDLMTTQQELRASIEEYKASLDRQARLLTIRFGIMWAVGICVLVIIVKFT